MPVTPEKEGEMAIIFFGVFLGTIIALALRGGG